MQTKTFVTKYKTMQWLIFAIACLLYSNTIPNKWAIDDSIIIHQNKLVKQGISGLPALFTCDAFTGYYGKDVNMVAGGRYRPMTLAWFALNAQLLADDENLVESKTTIHSLSASKDLSADTAFPNLLHAFNTIWYGILCLLLYRTLKLMFQLKWGYDSLKVAWIAFVGALLFTVHPLHTEVVANVKGLDEIWALLFALGALNVLLQTQTKKDLSSKRKLRLVLGAMLFFTLALFSKESSVTFIAIIPLAFYFFTDAKGITMLKLTAPLLLPLTLFLGARHIALHQEEKVVVAEELMNDPFLVLDRQATYAPLVPGSSIQKITNPNANTFVKMPFSNQLATNIYTYGVYLKLLVFPKDLTVDYYPRHIAVKSFSDTSVLFSLLIHLFFAGYAVMNLRRRKIVAFGILFYFITFSPVSNLFFPIGTNMAERFMFIPSVGFCFIIASLLYELAQRINLKKSTNGFLISGIGVGVVTLLFSIRTFNRNFDWKDNFTLFLSDIEVSKNSGKLNMDLASEFIGKTLEKVHPESELFIMSEAERKNALQNAIVYLKKALYIHPMSHKAWLNTGNAYHFLGEMEINDAQLKRSYLETALAAYNEAYFYRGKGLGEQLNELKALCLMNLGKLEGQQFGHIDTAIAYLERARKLSPKSAEIHLLLGTAYSINGNLEAAILNSQKAVELDPLNLDAKQNLAVAYQQMAFNQPAKRILLPKAEQLLLEVVSERKKDKSQLTLLMGTFDLLVKNATIRGDLANQKKYLEEMQALTPNSAN